MKLLPSEPSASHFITTNVARSKSMAVGVLLLMLGIVVSFSVVITDTHGGSLLISLKINGIEDRIPR